MQDARDDESRLPVQLGVGILVGAGTVAGLSLSGQRFLAVVAGSIIILGAMLGFVFTSRREMRLERLRLPVTVGSVLSVVGLTAWYVWG